MHFVVRVTSRAGKEAWLQVNAACVDTLGEAPVYLLLFIDITNETELRLMQEKLEKQAQELKTDAYECDCGDDGYCKSAFE